MAAPSLCSQNSQRLERSRTESFTMCWPTWLVCPGKGPHWIIATHTFRIVACCWTRFTPPLVFLSSFCLSTLPFLTPSPLLVSPSASRSRSGSRFEHNQLRLVCVDFSCSRVFFHSPKTCKWTENRWMEEWMWWSKRGNRDENLVGEAASLPHV